MRIVDCAGSPRARGQAHGEILRACIAEALDRWSDATLAGQGAQDNIDTWCRRFLVETTLLQCAERLTPSAFEEMSGIAEGADQPLHRIAAYNLMDEQWWFDARSDAPPPGCSLIALPVDGGHVLAQNMDLPGHMGGSQIALRLSGPDIPDTILLSAAGMIGLTGANAAGVGVGVNTLLMLGHDGAGLPVAFALRHALAARSRAEAAARLVGASHASGQHYALVTRDGIESLECSAGGAAEVALGRAHRLLHTNHPLASDDIDAASQARLDKAGFNRSSQTRLGWLQRKDREIVTATDVQALFDDPEAPLCMRAATNGGSSTFASVLYQMTDQPRVRMRAGLPGYGDWCDIGFPEATLTRP